MKEQNGNGFAPSIAQAIEEMKAEQGDSFSLERINLAELERRTGVSRSRLRRLKRNGFQDLPRSTKGSRHKVTKLSGYTGLLDSLLRQGVKNSSVVLELLGFTQNSPKETGRNSQIRIKRKSHYSKPFKSFILNSDQTPQ